MNILLVEDNQETVAFISRGLGEAGDAVTVAMSAQEGLLAAAAHSFDVIIFDRLLPGMDGVDAVRFPSIHDAVDEWEAPRTDPAQADGLASATPSGGAARRGSSISSRSQTLSSEPGVKTRTP